MLSKTTDEKKLLRLKIIPLCTYPLFLLLLIPKLSPELTLWVGFLIVIIGFALTSISSVKINRIIESKPEVSKTENTKSNKQNAESDNELQSIHKILKSIQDNLAKNTESNNNKPTGVDKIRTELFVPILILFGSILIYQVLSTFIGLGPDECDSGHVEYFKCFREVSDLSTILLSNGTVLLISFFAIGILYYHGCMIVLRGAPVESVGGKNRYAIAEYAIILIEAIILFFAATSIGSLDKFAVCIVLLIVVDLIWIFCNFRETLKLAFHWIYFDFTMLFFLITLIATPQHVTYAYFFVLAVFVTRTILDYKLGWKKFWSKYGGGLL